MLRVRLGITLIELLVVIGIIGVLASLLGPAVQNAREASRRIDCGNRTRQVALGCQLFHDAFGLIPANGGPAAGNNLTLVGGPLVVPQTEDFEDGNRYDWGVGDSERSPRDQTGSWAFAILPFVELGSQWNVGDCGTVVALYRCPSRPRGPVLPPADDAYGRYVSGGVGMSKTDRCGNRRVMPNRPDWLANRDLIDGLSQTILLGEKAIDPAIQTETSWYWDEPIWLGGSKGTARDGLRVLNDRVGIPFKDNWGSAHGAGTWFAFADGRVQLITTSVDWQLLAASLSPNGREVEGVGP